MLDRPCAPVRPDARSWRTAALWWMAGLFSALLLAAATTDSFASFTATVAPGVGPERGGTLAMTLTGPDGAAPCSSDEASGRNTEAATCSALTSFGAGPLSPSRATTTTMTVTNRGTVPAAGFTINFGPCHTGRSLRVHRTDAPDLCRHLNLSLTRQVGSRSDTVVDTSADTSAGVSAGTSAGNVAGTLAELGERGAYALPPVDPGQSVVLTLRTTLSRSVGNACQGLTAAQPLTLQFTA